MADSARHFRWIVLLEEGLEDLLRDAPDAFVAGDLPWYPVQGQPRICAGGMGLNGPGSQGTHGSA